MLNFIVRIVTFSNGLSHPAICVGNLPFVRYSCIPPIGQDHTPLGKCNAFILVHARVHDHVFLG